MDYKELTKEFINNMNLIQRARPHKSLNDSMQGENFVLQYLSHQSGSALPSEISNTMGISTARIAATLNSLEKKGYVTRRIDSNDRRRILVDLTEEGKKMALEHRQHMIDEMAKLLSLLGEEDAKEYVRITSKMAAMISKHHARE